MATTTTTSISTPRRIGSPMSPRITTTTSSPRSSRLSMTRASKLSAVMGFFYLDGEAGGLVKNIFFGDLPFALFGTTDGKTLTTSYALYGELNWRFSPKWTLNLGLRPTRETKNGIAYNAGYTDDTFTEVFGRHRGLRQRRRPSSRSRPISASTGRSTRRSWPTPRSTRASRAAVSTSAPRRRSSRTPPHPSTTRS